MRTLYPLKIKKLEVSYYGKEFHLNLIGTNMYYTSPYIKLHNLFKTLYKCTDFFKYNGRYSYA